MDTNEYLQPLDAPVTTHDNVTGFEFDTTSDRGMVNSFQVRNASIGSAQIGTAAIHTANIANLAVTSAKINSFSFNSGTGGTLTLGGTANGNGLLSLKNSGGTEIVRMDNTGLTVSNGSITIQDSSGSSVIDASGLVSTSSFANSQVTDSNQFTTTSTTYVVVNNMSLTFSLTRTTNVLVAGGGACWNQSAVNNAQFRLEVDGTLVGPTLPGQANSNPTPVFSSVILTLGSGSHTLKQKLLAVNAGTATMPADVKTLYYIVLGK